MTAEDRAAHVEREAVVGVLAEHYWADTRGDSGDRDGKWWRCRCGHEENIAGMSGWWSWRDAHDRHLADAVLAALPQTGDAAALARVFALADEWEAAGTVSVYESAGELGQILRAALIAGADQ